MVEGGSHPSREVSPYSESAPTGSTVEALGLLGEDRVTRLPHGLAANMCLVFGKSGTVRTEGNVRYLPAQRRGGDGDSLVIEHASGAYSNVRVWGIDCPSRQSRILLLECLIDAIEETLSPLLN